MTDREIMEALLNWKKLRRREWAASRFIYLDSSGEVYCEDGDYIEPSEYAIFGYADVEIVE